MSLIDRDIHSFEVHGTMPGETIVKKPKPKEETDGR